jgi:hypothetical protein
MKAITPTMIPKITRITPPIINLICQRQKRERTETGMSEKECGRGQKNEGPSYFSTTFVSLSLEHFF